MVLVLPVGKADDYKDQDFPAGKAADCKDQDFPAGKAVDRKGQDFPAGKACLLYTSSYSHLAEGSDYTTTRQIKKDKKGNYFSYFKKEGSDDDYKEVISNKELYRYNRCV